VTTAGVVFDKKDQLEKVQAAIVPGEQLLAVFDMSGGGTGFIGITTKRLIFYDKSFMRRMKALVSIPYPKINSVAAEDESGLFTGRGFFSSSKLVVHSSSGEFEFTFRGADKAHLAHQLIMEHLL